MEDETDRLSQTSVTDYQSVLCNISDEQRSHTMCTVFIVDLQSLLEAFLNMLLTLMKLLSGKSKTSGLGTALLMCQIVRIPRLSDVGLKVTYMFIHTYVHTQTHVYIHTCIQCVLNGLVNVKRECLI